MLDARRRDFIALLGGAAAWPLAARAQPSEKTYRIGFLGALSHGESRRQTGALRTGLRGLGWEEGKNIVIEYQWAEGKYERLPELAAALVKLNVDVIVAASGTAGALAAKRATLSVPVVMVAVADPVATGLVTSLARPGGNLTGSTFFFAEINAKRVELIKEAIPTLTRVAVLGNLTNPSYPIALAAMQRTASALRVQLVSVEVKGRDDIAPAIATLAARLAQALVVIDDPLITSNARQIADFALQNGLPIIGRRPFAEAGALMAYEVNLEDLFYRSAAFVDKILKGIPPADLPIERAVKFELVVNLKTAKALGIELPTSILLRADEVIE